MYFLGDEHLLFDLTSVFLRNILII